MVFWKNKKEKVPDSLPDLISDEIEKASGEINKYLKEEEKGNLFGKKEEFEKISEKRDVNREFFSPDLISEGVRVEKPKQIFVEPKVAEERSANPRPIPKSSKEIVSRLLKTMDEVKKPLVQEEIILKSNEIEKSFFDELQENLKSESQDLSKLGKFYEDKFLSRDILTDMKSYWENQKTATILDKVGRNFQEKISSKISKLQELEKLWQNIYFELIEKEEEIKENESELKKILKEFMDICKDKKKDLEVDTKKKVARESSKNEKKRKS